MTAATKPIPNESAAGRGRAETRAKAAGSLCAPCLTKSKEKKPHAQPERFRVLTDGKSAGKVHCAKNQGCMRKCRLYRKRAKSACEGRCNADGKDVEQEKRAPHSGSAGVLRKSGGGERKKKGKNPLKFFVSAGSDGR